MTILLDTTNIINDKISLSTNIISQGKAIRNDNFYDGIYDVNLEICLRNHTFYRYRNRDHDYRKPYFLSPGFRHSKFTPKRADIFSPTIKPETPPGLPRPEVAKPPPPSPLSHRRRRAPEPVLRGLEPAQSGLTFSAAQNVNGHTQPCGFALVWGRGQLGRLERRCGLGFIFGPKASRFSDSRGQQLGNGIQYPLWAERSQLNNRLDPNVDRQIAEALPANRNETSQGR
jgi:hypothetical protein